MYKSSFLRSIQIPDFSLFLTLYTFRKIYLHEKGQFWPKSDMRRVGQTEAIDIKVKTLFVGEFELVQRRILDTPERPCEEDERFSLTECMLEFVAGRVGCHLDWVGRSKLPHQPPCESLQELKEYSDLLQEMGDFSWATLSRQTGCHGKCQYKEYRFNKVVSDNLIPS